MAENGGGGSTGVVAVVAIFLVIVLAIGISPFRGRIFDGGSKKVNVTIQTPSK